jgi:hypothetical protein
MEKYLAISENKILTSSKKISQRRNSLQKDILLVLEPFPGTNHQGIMQV